MRKMRDDKLREMYKSATERLDVLDKKLTDLTKRTNEMTEQLADMGMKIAALEFQEGTNNGAWMQDGIDSILGYQWPPKRGDGK